MLTYKICVTGIVVFPQWQMTMRHWCWRIEYVSLALSSSFSAPLRVMSSSQCTSESGAFNSAPITLIHYSHSINTPVYRLFHQTILVVFLLYTPTLVSFLKSQNMSSNYHQYGNNDSNYFLKVHNNNTDFGEIFPNYAQTSSYAKEVFTFNPIEYYLNYSSSFLKCSIV
jgi:hypothetical protein